MRSHQMFGKKPSAPTGIGDFLRANERMASLLPTAMRMASLQKDCAAALPAMFSLVEILQFEGGNLVLATPNAAVAAKLKQQAPKLQAALQQRGWQVEHIRLKVQVVTPIAPQEQMRALSLSPKAVDAFAELGETLDETPQNATLIAALRNMVARRRA